MVTLFLAEGFEEIEAMTPVDILRRGGVEVQTCSVDPSKKEVRGAHGILVLCDITLEEVDPESEMLILPGGMPGTLHLKESRRLASLLRKQHESGRYLAAICAAPTVLGGLGILKEEKATCYPGMETELFCKEFSEEDVVVSRHIITSRGAGTAFAFGLRLLALLKDEKTAQKIGGGMVYAPAVRRTE